MLEFRKKAEFKLKYWHDYLTKLNGMIDQAQQNEMNRKDEELEMYKKVMEAGTAAREEEEDRLHQCIESLTARLKAAEQQVREATIHGLGLTCEDVTFSEMDCTN